MMTSVLQSKKPRQQNHHYLFVGLVTFVFSVVFLPRDACILPIIYFHKTSCPAHVCDELMIRGLAPVVFVVDFTDAGGSSSVLC